MYFEKRGVYSRFDRNYKGPSHFRIHHEDESSRGKARFWVWIVVTTVLIGVLGYLTEFMDRCRESGVFSGTVFRVSALFFIISTVLGGILRFRWAQFHRNRTNATWERHPILFGSTIVSCLICVTTFTAALVPPYGEACLAFGSCALLFIVNLGCLLFYD